MLKKIQGAFPGISGASKKKKRRSCFSSFWRGAPWGIWQHGLNECICTRACSGDWDDLRVTHAFLLVANNNDVTASVTSLTGGGGCNFYYWFLVLLYFNCIIVNDSASREEPGRKSSSSQTPCLSVIWCRDTNTGTSAASRAPNGRMTTLLMNALIISVRVCLWEVEGGGGAGGYLGVWSFWCCSQTDAPLLLKHPCSTGERHIFQTHGWLVPCLLFCLLVLFHAATKFNVEKSEDKKERGEPSRLFPLQPHWHQRAARRERKYLTRYGLNVRFW